MTTQELLAQILDFCRQNGLAESTFGRRAVNDGKLANRLRNGGRITTDTLDRIRAFLVENRAEFTSRPALIPRPPAARLPAEPLPSLPASPPPAQRLAATPGDPQRNFRFFDN